MVGKAFIIVESQGFDECFRDPCQHLLKCGLGVIGLARGDLRQPGQKRRPIGDDQQGRFMGFVHHEVGLKISQAGAPVNYLRTMVDTHAAGENPPGVVVIASFAASTAMFKVPVKLFGRRVFLALASPDPLIDRLVADAIDAADGPATADQLRAEFFGFQPPYGVFL